jgi:hypothetical protein
MRTQKFLVQIEDNGDTRWHFNQDEAARIFECAIANVARSMTAGPIPRVTVIVEEDRNPIDERARQ